MKANDIKLTALFTGDNTRYSIPVYQRKYSWDIKQCRQLWKDITILIGNKKKHFFGSVVRLSDEYENRQIIDGQQRLTTVSLIWLAMLQLIREDKQKDASGVLETRIKDKLCFYNDDGTLSPRIEHVDADSKAYNALILGNKEKYENNSFVTSNFWFFYNTLKTGDYELQDVYNAIDRLVIADVKLSKSEGDDPQEVFESLNSTGLALSDGDKIRNYMLMNLDAPLQKEYYYDYWIDIEKFSNYTGERNDARNAVTFFVRDYMTAKTTHIPALHEVYSKFKEYAADKDTKELLADMKKYAKYLFELENGKTESPKINDVLKRIALLEMTVLHPFEFNILKDFYNGKLTEKQIISVLELSETFIFRRLICEVPTNALNKIFATLYYIATSLSEREGISLYDAIAYILTSKTDSGRFPSNAEFKEAWQNKNIYKMRAKNKIYIFYRLNAGKSLEGDTSVIDKMQQDSEGKTILSIEHIMPQSLNRKWIEDLGGEEKAHEIQGKWEHTIANLTLTAYNSPYSNSSFQEKLECKDENGIGIGFKYSPLHINDFVKQQTKWGEEELEQRLALIQRDATNIIWPMPTVNYTPTVKIAEELTLNDDKDDFTSKYFIDGTVNGTTIPEKPYRNWKAVFITIMKILDRDYHFDLLRMANDESQTSIQNEKTKFDGSTKLFDGVYAYLSTSTSTKIGVLKDVFEYVGIDLDSLVFHVKGEENDN